MTANIFSFYNHIVSSVRQHASFGYYISFFESSTLTYGDMTQLSTLLLFINVIPCYVANGFLYKYSYLHYLEHFVMWGSKLVHLNFPLMLFPTWLLYLDISRTAPTET